MTRDAKVMWHVRQLADEHGAEVITDLSGFGGVCLKNPSSGKRSRALHLDEFASGNTDEALGLVTSRVYHLLDDIGLPTNRVGERVESRDRPIGRVEGHA